MTKFLQRWNINVRSAYFRILVSTIAVTVIPILILYCFIYIQTLHTIEQQSQVIDKQFLEKTQENVEQILHRVQMDAASLANSRDSISFVFSRQVSDWTVVLRLGRDLASLAEYNSLIDSAYLYSANNGMLITSDNRYYPAAEFYDRSWLDIYHQELSPIYWTESRTIVKSDSTTSTGISLILHVPSASRKQSGAVVLNLSEEHLDTELLSGGLQQSSSRVEILDQTFRPLLDESESEEILREVGTDWFASQTGASTTVRIGGESCLVTYTYSALLEWYFIRTSELGTSVSQYLDVWKLLVLFAVILLLACLFAVRVSRQLYQPVRKLVEEVTGQSFDREELSDEYKTIHTEYSKMRTKTSALESELTELQPLIRERFFLRLLRGQADAPEQELAEFGFSQTSYAVVAVRYSSVKRSAPGNNDLRYFQVRARMEDILQDSPAFRFACVETSGDTLVAVINFKEVLSPTDVRRLLLGLSKCIRETLAAELHIDTVTGFSPLCRTVSEIPAAYAAALKSVRFKLFQDSDDVVSEDDELFAPYSVLLHELLEQISAGNKDYVRAALDELFLVIRQNLDVLSQFQIQQIAMWILNSVIELLIQNKLKTEQVFGEKRNLFAELRQRDDIDSICKWMEGVCVQAAGELSLANVKQTNQKVVHMKEYIEQHISEDISLNDISAWVGLSPAYVSRTFKENTGQNFVEYLSICRVEQAKELLKNTQLSIKEIGFKSGFNSMQTFIRTFKKLEHCTPSQYRDSE